MPVPPGAPWYLLTKLITVVLIGVVLMIVTWQRTSSDAQSLGLALLWAAVVWTYYRRRRRACVHPVLPVTVKYPGSFAL